MVFVVEDSGSKRSFENALALTGFGKYNVGLLVACVLLNMAMNLDIFGFSIVMPAVACDMGLNTAQQGILAAVPLIGVMISSYVWGLAADTIGRRKTLLIAMPVGFILNMAATMSPNYATLAVLKFFSAAFTSSANAANFVLLAESVPSKQRNRFMSIMAASSMCTQFIAGCFAIPVFKLKFHLKISWLNMEYTNWRLLTQLICIPGLFGILCLWMFKESPKFLLSQQRNEEALLVLKTIFQSNTGNHKDAYSVTQVYIDDLIVSSTESSVLKKIWNQTAPIFKPPLLKNSAILYYLLLSAYMVSTGFSMWVATISNAFFTGENNSGLTFCKVARNAASSNGTEVAAADCDNVLQPKTIYAVISYAGILTILGILLQFIIDPLGKKSTTLLIFIVTSLCGVLLFFVTLPLLNIALFYMFLAVCLILGNVNTYLVELNPTHLRGMATCLSVVVARGFSFISVQIIATLLENYCTAMMSGYVLLVFSGLLISTLLPSDSKSKNFNIVTDTEPVKKSDNANLKVAVHSRD